MRWAGRVARMRRGEVHAGFRWGDVREGYHVEDIGVDGNVVLKWFFSKQEEGMTGLIWR